MTPEAREALRQYIAGIISDTPFGGDHLVNVELLVTAKIPQFLITIIVYLGQLLAAIGGF
jgi:hypothetical protein